MGLYTSLKLAHVIGAAVLFGTGVGIAFFMLMAIAHVTRPWSHTPPVCRCRRYGLYRGGSAAAARNRGSIGKSGRATAV